MVSQFCIFSDKGGRKGQACSDFSDYVWMNMQNWPNPHYFSEYDKTWLNSCLSWLVFFFFLLGELSQFLIFYDKGGGMSGPSIFFANIKCEQPL